MKEFKKPDLKAPRFRPDRLINFNDSLISKFKKKYPKYRHIDKATLKMILKKFNTTVVQEVINNRNGISLPESLGWLFIAACNNPKKKNVDFYKSKTYGVEVTNNNWDSDGKLAKIVYSNMAPKHKFKNREYWSFTACRDFKRGVAKTFPENWQNYTALTPDHKIKDLYLSSIQKDLKTKQIEKDLESYNEFDI